MYIHTLACFCESQRRFPLFSPLNILHTLFSVCLSLPLLPCLLFVPLLLHSPGARPSAPLSCLPSLRLSFACPSAPAPVVCSVPAVPFVLRSSSPFIPIGRAPEAPRRSSVCPAVCRAACPSLVSYQAQNGVAVWADAPRVCPRPCLLLPMCCRCSFRCPFRGFRPCVRVCVLPCVVWWQ